MTPLSPTDRAALLGIARGAILSHLGIAPAPALPERGPLAEPRGAFVTVSVRGELRGCIGTLRPTDALARTVARMAVSAATEDPRFVPLSSADVPELGLAVSVLGEPFRLAEPRAVKVGAHGLVVRKGWHRGVLLPKVAAREGWDVETFLKHVCLKAGLPARAWQEPDTELDAFEADEFGEEPT
ncbi:AmmeMemoRadiSam system protein A [Anaeromyxobacter oryzae]|uniref:AmmeMemoRadiSam system protein A n=1 Tax=Anaeromyxobacter oryzae TaxID=2918170 RepID=A0ABM7WRB5_9BACT|nr:AmmeMemoRadiSam system protein A [Anaeromyxobacter oryzae]BDG01999.1 AmmeMemoRadiSam system protein A [Anaeromyxobacter oryzae]